MSAIAVPRPQIGDRERLSATLVLSLLLHGMLILGVGFVLSDAAPVLPTLDVILTQTRTALTPKQADFLAQANNQGGGEDDKASRPRDSQTGDIAKPEDGIAPRELRAQTPAPQPPPRFWVLPCCWLFVSSCARAAKSESTTAQKRSEPFCPAQRAEMM